MPDSKRSKIDARAVELADFFRMMGDASRLRIVLACMDGPISVGDIATGLELSPSLVSHHLRLLRSAGILEPTRKGKQVFYDLPDQHIRRVIVGMLGHLAEQTPDQH